jgi:ABC-type multidrug transport system ATPase subunit
VFQAIGLTKSFRRGRPPALLDLSFDARDGQVTVLLGPEGSGRTTALRLALGLDRGQGVALFDGRTYRRIRRPERQVGVVLGDTGRHPGHPGREARAHLRMVAAAVGVPARRADQLLEQTRLAPAAGHRLRTFSPGMSRRLALAEALLGNPGTLLLDEPTHGLSPKNTEWFHAFLRAFAAGGGSVLATVRDPNEAAALADHVVTLDGGRLVADQTKADFVGGRLRDEVSVRGPQVGRLADLLAEAGAQVRREGGAGIAVVGVSRTQIGELAYRHGILLHELADRTAGSAPGAPAVPPLPQRRSTEATAAGSPVAAAAAAAASASTAPAQPGETVVVLTPGIAVSASVPVPTADTATRSRVPAGLASVSGPLYRDEPPVSDQRSE